MSKKAETILREYDGNGKLLFSDGAQLDCDFKIVYHSNGAGFLDCVVPITKEFARILAGQIKEVPEDVDYASLDGKLSDGGTISIPRMGINTTKANLQRIDSPNSSAGLKDPEVVEALIGVARIMNIDPADIKNGRMSGTGHLSFLIISTIEIGYDVPNENEFVSVVYGLTNFRFNGCEWSSYGNERRTDKFNVDLTGMTVSFQQLLDYESIISDLSVNRGTRITAEALTSIRYSDLPKLKKEIERASMILSFATANWVIMLYCDVFKNGKVIRTFLHIHKTFPFAGAHESISNTNLQNCYLRQFLSVAQPKFDSLKQDFGIHFVIEYYISALTQRTPNEKFLIAFVALECLSSYALSYAEKHGETLQRGAKEAALAKIRALSVQENLPLTEEQLVKIIDKIGSNTVGIKDELRYLSQSIGFPYETNEINKLVSARGQLIHTGRHEHTELVTLTDELFYLLDRIVLTMFGWKGMPFISKKHAYTPRVLE